MDADSWKGILASAAAILDELAGRGVEIPELTLGGGTVLMLRLHHRLSRDVDLFVDDVQFLTRITPRLNDFSAAMARDYVEQANSVKIVLDDGDIDFIAAGSVTGARPTERLDHAARRFLLEPSQEIIGKKLLYRAEFLKPRDVFDLVAVADADRAVADQALTAASSKADVLKRRLAQLASRPVAEIATDIHPMTGFEHLIPTMLGSALRLVADAAGGRA